MVTVRSLPMALLQHIRSFGRAKMAVLFMWMEAWVHWVKYLGFEWYNRLKWLVVQVLSIVALLIVLVWLSVFMYGTFYYSYMPAVTHTRDVHLQFSTDCESDEGLCSFPSANLTLSKDGQSEILMRGQPYVMVVDFDLPESQVNQNLGMFMVKLQLYGRHGAIVRTSRRSAMLQYKSALYQILETLFYAPMYLGGMRSQKQQLAVTLFDSYEEDPYKPAIGAIIEVQSKRVEIYSSVLRIHAKFAGLRYLLYHWPIVSALCGIGTNMFFLVVCTLLSWNRFGEVPNEPTAQGSLTGTQRMTLEERRNRIRAILDRERQGLTRTGSSSSFSGTKTHSFSQPNLSSHRRSASATYHPGPSPETIAHSASASNLQDMSADQDENSFSSEAKFRISQDSIATTDYGDEEDDKDNYSTPSSGSGSRSASSELRQRRPLED